MNYRRLASGVGVISLAFGLVAVVSPGLVAFELDRVLVSAIGVLALGQAVRVVQTRRHGTLDEAETPDPERPVATPSPGADLESVIGQFLDTPRIYYRRPHIRDGLRSAAVSVLTQYGGYSEARAAEAVAAGTWTDDTDAAAFLGSEDAPAPPLRAWLRDVVGREPSLQRNARHAVDEIAAIAGVTPPTAERAVRRSRQRDTRRADASPDDSPTRPAAATDAVDDATGDVVARESHPTGHWRGVSVVAFVGIGLGILVEQPAVLLAGVVGIGFAAYARSSALPPGDVSIDRTLSTDRPAPGDDVEVTVTVTNETDRLLPDVRLVDGVPDALAVTNGSPRLGTALRPGASATFTYTVTARRGAHAFGPTTLVARDLTAEVEQERFLHAENTLTCLPSLQPLAEPVPLREQAAQHVGRVETPSGGDGVEFYATREYRSGDAMSRIDWNRRARTGELTTVEFREERAATVVVVVDARASAYLSPEPHAPHAVDRAVDAAGRIFATLSEAGDRVGVAALSSEPCWLAPGSGRDHEVEARELLATHPALTSVPPDGQSPTIQWRKQLRKRLPPGAQVVLLTPLCDDYSGRFARRLDEHGYPVTVVSLDPTADRTPSHRLARVARLLRVSTLRGCGLPVVDWPWADTVDVAVARHDERWSR